MMLSHACVFYSSLPLQNSFPEGVTKTFAATSPLLWVMFPRISVYFAFVLLQKVFLLIADGGGRDSS